MKSDWSRQQSPRAVLAQEKKPCHDLWPIGQVLLGKHQILESKNWFNMSYIDHHVFPHARCKDHSRYALQSCSTDFSQTGSWKKEIDRSFLLFIDKEWPTDNGQQVAIDCNVHVDLWSRLRWFLFQIGMICGVLNCLGQRTWRCLEPCMLGSSVNQSALFIGPLLWLFSSDIKARLWLMTKAHLSLLK